MHELTATQNILSIVLAEAAKVGAARVVRVSVKVGEWSTIEPECMEFCFRVLAQGTPAEGAQLAIERIPVRYRCGSCGLEYIPEGGSYACPGCSGASGTLVSGRELFIDSIEVVHADTRVAKSAGRERPARGRAARGV